MSSRTGNVITFEWLLDETEKRILGLMNKESISDTERKIVAEKVALGAIRYALLKSNIGSDVIFDFGKSVSFEGDSGPYLMYTYARCKSVIRKAAADSGQVGMTSLEGVTLNIEETELLRAFYRFEEVIWEAARDLAPNTICSYLYDLAQKFNLFYQKHSILGSDNRQHITNNRVMITEFRLALTRATAGILKRGLYILGIESVERM